MLMGDNGIITKAVNAKTEMRGATVEEEKELWASNLNANKYTDATKAETLNEFIDRLVEEKNLTEDEKDIILGNENKGIEATGKVTIGSRTIVFTNDTNNIQNISFTPTVTDIESSQITINSNINKEDLSKIQRIYYSIDDGATWTDAGTELVNTNEIINKGIRTNSSGICDTGITLTGNYRIETQIVNNSFSSDYQNIWGIGTTEFESWINSSDKEIGFRHAGTRMETYDLNMQEGVAYSIVEEVKDGVATTTIDGKQYMTGSVNTATANDTVKLFTSTRNTCETDMTMYYFKVYLEDELKLDLIPVEKGETINGQTSIANGFYDKVSKTFMYSNNKEYAAIITYKQQEVPKGTYIYKKLIQDTLYNVKVKAVLKDNSEIITDSIKTQTKKILSKGTRTNFSGICDTGIILTGNYRIETQILNNSFSSKYQNIWGIGTTSFESWINSGNKEFGFRHNGIRMGTYDLNMQQGVVYTIVEEVKNGVATASVDGKQYMTENVNTATADSTIKLFTSTSNTCETDMTMYYFKVYINEELKLDLIPVENGETINGQEATANGFYDKISKKFMYSNGKEYDIVKKYVE